MDVAKHDVLRLGWTAELELRVDLGERHALLEPGDEACRSEPHDGFPACVRVEPDAREWNADLGEPAVLRDGRASAPERVPIAVERGAVVGDELVEAHASGREAEPLRVAVVVERIDVQRECVVAVPAVAIERVHSDA